MHSYYTSSKQGRQKLLPLGSLYSSGDDHEITNSIWAINTQENKNKAEKGVRKCVFKG